MQWSGTSVNSTIVYSNVFTVVFTVILLALPIWITVFFFCKQERLSDADSHFFGKYETLLSELDLSNTRVRGNKRCTSLIWNILFVLRRLIFAVCAILL